MKSHVLWPEGLPSEAYTTNSLLKARWFLFKKQSYYLIHMTKARRMRHLITEGKPGDPHTAEYVLKMNKCIPPPGGWPNCQKTPSDTELAPNIISFITYAVI